MGYRVLGLGFKIKGMLPLHQYSRFGGVHVECLCALEGSGLGGFKLEGRA